nr:hypothetical protein Iba_chr06eCG4750 [Ipomoea batatas]
MGERDRNSSKRNIASHMAQCMTEGNRRDVTYHMKKKNPVTSAGYLSKNPTLVSLRGTRVRIIRAGSMGFKKTENGHNLPGGAIGGGLTRTENLPLHRRRNNAGGRSLEQNSRSQLPSPYQVPGVADRLRGGGREAEGVAPRRRRQRLPKKWEAASGGGAMVALSLEKRKIAYAEEVNLRGHELEDGFCGCCRVIRRTVQISFGIWIEAFIP